MSDQPPCPVCGDPVDPAGDLGCRLCGSPHHLDCWRFSGGCSRFGCGGEQALPLAEVLAAEGGGGALVIDETTALESPARPFLPSLWRRMKGPARALPWTVGLGALGAAAALAAITVVDRPPREPMIWMAMLGSGVFHGLLAPYLAPLQHRRPWVMGLAGAVAFAFHFSWLVGTSVRHLPEIAKALLLVSCLVSATIGSTSLAEGVLGPRSRLGQALGRASLPARLLGTWVAAVALWLLLVWWQVPYSRLDLGDLFKAGQLALFAALPAFPALERGKAEFRGWFPNSGGGSGRISGEDPDLLPGS